MVVVGEWVVDRKFSVQLRPKRNNKLVFKTIYLKWYFILVCYFSAKSDYHPFQTMSEKVKI